MIVALAIGLILQSTAAAPCIVDGERLSGELRYVETHHPNGSLIRSAFLYLDEPRCVDDELGHAEGRWVQLLPADPRAFARIRSGSGIVIQSDDYFAPHTAWHIGDIVAGNAHVVSSEPP